MYNPVLSSNSLHSVALAIGLLTLSCTKQSHASCCTDTAPQQQHPVELQHPSAHLLATMRPARTTGNPSTGHYAPSMLDLYF